MKYLLPTIFLLLFISPSCKAIEKIFRKVHVAAGTETSIVNLYTRRSGFIASLRPDVGENRLVFHSNNSAITRAYLAVSSPPDHLPYLKKFWLFRYITFSARLKTPAVFRGNMYGYPDDGFQPNSLTEAILLETTPLPNHYRNRLEFLYEETQAFITFYLPYIKTKNFYFGFGFNWGIANYNLEIHKDNQRVSNEVGKWRPLTSLTITYGYKMNKLFPKNRVLGDTYLFLELVTENAPKHALKTDLFRSNGSKADPLFVAAQNIRFGVRKQVTLIEPAVKTIPTPKKIETKKAPLPGPRDNDASQTPTSGN